ncbi:MAG: carboxypeptidase-like regulatory domain-containing protein, partial [Chitinophagaceae bacterium]|nr:carboxypeptidase-like regulatory domain-containing protein [Chitinophagaceae bacterium]
DSFLADALEGYAIAGVNVNADIAELKRRLAGKAEEKKVIPIHGSSRYSFPWLRAAAVIIFLAGAGLLSYQFLFKTKNTDIAQAPQKETQTTNNSATVNAQTVTNIPDTPATNATNNVTSGTVGTPPRKISEKEQFSKSNNDPGTETATVASEKKELAKSIDDKTAPVTGNVNDRTKNTERLEETANKPVVASTSKPAAINTDAVKKDVAMNDDAARQQGRFSKQRAENDADKSPKEGVVTAKDIPGTNRSNQGYLSNMNYFRGKVTDANNNPLPFTNVVNTVDNVGTYSDAKGNFTLVSTDSMMDVQLRSLGFENNKIRLRSDIPTNQIMMQEDRSLNARILDTVKRNFAVRSREGNMTFEEPEPADGWTSYGSYLANNLNVPESFDTKKNIDQNVVELSFEVNKFGDPVNIRVEKSLCDKCDKEAIRLVKEGPKWKRKAKKGKRTTVRVPFIKPSDW